MAIEPYITEEKIRARVKELGEQISKDFNGEEVVVVTVLTGAFIFAADLVREMSCPVKCEFMKASSYHDSTESSGEVRIEVDLKHSIEGKNVLVVEDIVDTGLTLSEVLKFLKFKNPKSLKLASLLHKPARQVHEVPIDYLAFEIEDKFVIGYGLDYAQKYRELPYIGIYSES